MTFEMRPVKPEERKYCFPQGQNLIAATGAICQIFGYIGEELVHRHVYNDDRFTESFQRELNELLETLMSPNSPCPAFCRTGGICRNTATAIPRHSIVLPVVWLGTVTAPGLWTTPT